MHKNELYQLIPKVDDLLLKTKNFKVFEKYSENFRKKIIQQTLDKIRLNIASEKLVDLFTFEEVLTEIIEYFKKKMKSKIIRVVNATGIILHTNMGRAVLPECARNAVFDCMGYTTLEIEQDTGKRGNRLDNLEPILTELTGAEGSVVVNNNAAATMIILAVLAQQNSEVIVARGQLVEIGGSFRLPEVMTQAGVVLKEVGATNRVHEFDYENAINENTAAIMKIHPSNFKLIGFTSEVSITELVEIGKKHGLPIVDDLGAGAFANISKYGYDPEPLVSESIQAGADMVCCSGDKLIGGVQAGIIVGKKTWIDKIKKHPLYRALRCDKLTLSALHETLKLFLDEETLPLTNPTWKMIAMRQAKALQIADQVATRIRESNKKLVVKAEKGFSELGSGSMPGMQIPSGIVTIMHPDVSAENLAAKLRQFVTPIYSRIENEKVVLDMRTLQPGDNDIIVYALNSM